MKSVHSHTLKKNPLDLNSKWSEGKTIRQKMNKKNQELQIGMKSYEKDFLKQIICQISPYENWHIA